MRATVTNGAAVFWLLALIAISTAVQGAPAYKCTDAEGRTTYTQLPVEGADCRQLNTRGYTPSPPPQKTPPAQNAPSATPEPAPAHSDSAGAQDPKARNCKLAQRNLEILQSDQPVVRTGADGRQVVLDAEQRAAALAQARKDLGYWCE